MRLRAFTWGTETHVSRNESLKFTKTIITHNLLCFEISNPLFSHSWQMPAFELVTCARHVYFIFQFSLVLNRLVAMSHLKKVFNSDLNCIKKVSNLLLTYKYS